MPKKIVLHVNTICGEFTRTTNSPYKFVCVREPLGGAAAFCANNKARAVGGGVFARYMKDRGFIVSWHMTKAAALKQLAGPTIYYVASAPVGVYPVTNPKGSK